MNGRSDYTKEGGLDKFFILDKRYLIYSFCLRFIEIFVTLPANNKNRGNVYKAHIKNSGNV